ncbi:hypothetical protein BBW65_05900 [Helicobacter enhydrae]|uniref:AI-2E family transporter n=2 Tax=Helicobacter enhydrae TaxID=222136 RepID=A0A1B1U7M6_9HELI|nr:hypothetical protein BBW65_05900 [Helicobacter enhydrae]
MAYLYNAFLMNMLIALLLCISTYFLKNFFDRFLPWNWLASFVSVLVLVVLFALPMYFVVSKGIEFVNSIDSAKFNLFVEASKAKILFWLSGFPEISMRIKGILSEFSGSKILGHALSMSADFAKWSVAFVGNVGFIVAFLYFFFYYSKAFTSYALKMIPLEKQQVMALYNEVSGVLSVVFFTSVFNILIQGVCFGVASYFLGYDGFLLGVLYGIASLVPVVGGAIVWVPVAFHQLYLGNSQGAIFVALYGAVFIGVLIDNVVKPILISLIAKKIIKTSVKINEMLIFFAILAGISVFGFSGIIIGPAATALFIALLRIYDSNFRV